MSVGVNSAVPYLLRSYQNIERAIAEIEVQRLEHAIVDKLETLQSASSPFANAGIGAPGMIPPPSSAFAGAAPGLGLSMNPLGWPQGTIGTAGGFNLFAPGMGALNVFGPGQSFGESPLFQGAQGPSILGDGTRLLMNELEGMLNVVNGMDRTSIGNFFGAQPTLGPIAQDGQQWLAQNWSPCSQGQGAGLPLGSPAWQNAFQSACGCPNNALFDQLNAFRNNLLPGACFNSGFAPPSSSPPKVYVFGNRDYPLSTAASAAKQVDTSKTLAQEFAGDNPNNKFGGIFDKLAPDAQQVSQQYGTMFGKSVVYDETGRLVGVYDTKQLEDMNKDYKLYGTSTAQGQTLKLPDGQSFQIADNAYASPLTFDLANKGQVGTVDMQHGRNFRMDPKGNVTAWAAAGEGILAFGDGSDGTKLLGNNAVIGGQHFANGFQALGALANQYLGAKATEKGYLDSTDLKTLEDKANLHMIVAGQTAAQDKNARPVEDLGIQKISLQYKEAGANADTAGNQHREVGAGFVQNGQTKKVDDVWYRVKGCRTVL